MAYFALLNVNHKSLFYYYTVLTIGLVIETNIVTVVILFILISCQTQQQQP